MKEKKRRSQAYSTPIKKKRERREGVEYALYSSSDLLSHSFETQRLGRVSNERERGSEDMKESSLIQQCLDPMTDSKKR